MIIPCWSRLSVVRQPGFGGRLAPVEKPERHALLQGVVHARLHRSQTFTDRGVSWKGQKRTIPVPRAVPNPPSLLSTRSQATAETVNVYIDCNGLLCLKCLSVYLLRREESANDLPQAFSSDL